MRSYIHCTPHNNPFYRITYMTIYTLPLILTKTQNSKYPLPAWINHHINQNIFSHSRKNQIPNPPHHPRFPSICKYQSRTRNYKNNGDNYNIYNNMNFNKNIHNITIYRRILHNIRINNFINSSIRNNSTFNHIFQRLLNLTSNPHN